MTPIAKLSLKHASAASTISNAQKSSTHQNPTSVNITNPAKQLVSVLDDSVEKINMIVMTSNIKKH